MKRKKILVYRVHLDGLLVYAVKLLLRDQDQVLDRGFGDGRGDGEGGTPLLENVDWIWELKGVTNRRTQELVLRLKLNLIDRIHVLSFLKVV